MSGDTRGTRWGEGAPIVRPGAASPAIVRFYRRVVLPIVRVAHRPTLEGVENLPAAGPYLLVANHSGGLGVAEINTFIALYAERFGGARPLAGFAHALSFTIWPLASLLRALGAIPSTYAAAEAALRAGVPILVFPGGDHEVLRPLWQAHRVDFGGRRGFLRIAQKEWVPIVPMGIRGSHFTAPTSFRSRLLAWLFVWPRLVGAKRWALPWLGIAGAALLLVWVPLEWPWRLAIAVSWLASPFAMAPFVPWSIRMRIGEPILPETLFGARTTTGEDALGPALSIVQGAVQDLVSAPSPRARIDGPRAHGP